MDAPTPIESNKMDNPAAASTSEAVSVSSSAVAANAMATTDVVNPTQQSDSASVTEYTQGKMIYYWKTLESILRVVVSVPKFYIHVPKFGSHHKVTYWMHLFDRDDPMKKSLSRSVSEVRRLIRDFESRLRKCEWFDDKTCYPSKRMKIIAYLTDENVQRNENSSDHDQLQMKERFSCHSDDELEYIYWRFVHDCIFVAVTKYARVVRRPNLFQGIPKFKDDWMNVLFSTVDLRYGYENPDGMSNKIEADTEDTASAYSEDTDGTMSMDKDGNYWFTTGLAS